MQPSTWNDTNQHWIPQFLLKGFGIRGKASSIYELDTQTNAWTDRNIEEVASKQHLLTDRDDELTRAIERRATKEIGAIRKGKMNRISKDDRQAIDRLVCAMMLNDPHSGFDAEATLRKVVAEVFSKLNEAISRYGVRLDESDFRNFFDQRLPQDWLSNFMKSTFNDVILALELMGLRVFRSPEGEFFIIGDSPVLVVRNAANGETSLLNRGSQVILPISSRYILVYTWETGMNVMNDGGTLDREQVHSLNSDYYHGTKCRHIYGRDEETLRRSQLKSPESPPRERSNDVKDGWTRMLQLEPKRQKQLEAQHAEQARILECAAHELADLAIAQSEHATSQASIADDSHGDLRPAVKGNQPDQRGAHEGNGRTGSVEL